MKVRDKPPLPITLPILLSVEISDHFIPMPVSFPLLFSSLGSSQDFGVNASIVVQNQYSLSLLLLP